MANEIKALTEQREDLNAEINALIDGAKAENRSMTEDEINRFNEAEKEIKAIDQTLAIEKRAVMLVANVPVKQSGADGNEDEQVSAEERSFVDYVKANAVGVPSVEYRAENLKMSENGAIVPRSIANKIITKFVETCPILEKCTRYNIKGSFDVPVWGATDDGDNITIAYQEDFKEMLSHAGKFKSITIKNYLAGGLVLVGRQLLSNSYFDVEQFLVNEISKQGKIFVEHELLIGTPDKATGATSTNNTLTISTTKFTADDLIELQTMVPTEYQDVSCWIMNKKSFSHCKKLKDGAGQYVLQPNMTLDKRFKYTILGAPVYISDAMPDADNGTTPILYGDYSGITANLLEDMTIEIYRELFAVQHAIGIALWLNIDSKITDYQRFAALKVETA